MSVIVVNYNAGDYLARCVAAVLAATARPELVIADNGSTDDSFEKIRKRWGNDPRVRLVDNGENLGFARGCNQATAHATGDYLLYLNPDCVIGPEVVARMTSLMEMRKEAGMAGGVLLNEDGTEQAGGRRRVPTPGRSLSHLLGLSRLFPSNPRFESFVMADEPAPGQVVEVDAISGAFMFIRRKALEEVGPFDEGYFMHCEDLDLCYRFWRAGWKILYDPATEVRHTRGVSSRSRPVKVEWTKSAGMIRYYDKFLAANYPRPLGWLVKTGVALRFALNALGSLLLFWKKKPPGPVYNNKV